jgi:hypothetical protein
MFVAAKVTPVTGSSDTQAAPFRAGRLAGGGGFGRVGGRSRTPKAVGRALARAW